jgi:ligand-binding sensor domain-containing protein
VIPRVRGGSRVSWLAAVLAVLWGSSPALADALRFDHLGVEHGLSAGWVKAILKDRRGFMWFGTVDGLDRYDGASFRRYAMQGRDAAPLPLGRVEAMLEDRSGRLWVGGNGGLAVYDRALDRFALLTNGDAPEGVVRDEVLALLQDAQGRLWVGTMAGLKQLDPESRRVRTYVHDPKDPATLGHDRVQCLAEDPSGAIWVGTAGGLNRLDPATGQVTRVPEQPGDPHGLALPADVAALHLDADRRLWVGTLGGGLQQLDLAGGRIVARYGPRPTPGASPGHPRVRRLAGDGAGRLYVGTEGGGLEVLEPGTGALRRYLPDIDDEDAINSNSVYAFLLDDQGLLWIGTFGDGVNMVVPQHQFFRVRRARHGMLSDPHVSGVLEDRQGDLWVATDGGGLDQIESGTGRVVHHRAHPDAPGRLRSDAVVGVFEDSKGRIWACTFQGGLSRYDRAQGAFVTYRHDPADPTSIVSNSAWTVVEEPNGELLVSTNDGVDVLDPASGRFRRLSDQFPGLRRGRVHVLVRERDGSLWLGGWDATEHLDRATGRITRYVNDPDDPGTIGLGNLYHAYADSRGNVWLATEGGLSVLEAGRGRMRRFTEADGLPHVKVTAIVEDEKGDVWLSTLRGLARLEQGIALPTPARFVAYGVHDGLPGPEFRRRSVFRSARGEIFFGSQHGLVSFFPGRLTLNTHAPPVVLTELQIFNRPALPGAAGSPLAATITETRELTLSPEHGVVSFSFASLSYVAPPKNRHAYRLEGFDPDWIDAGTRRTATYTNLPAGSYVFRVRGSNNDGVWNEEGLALRVTVLPPFWKTWWFAGLCVAAALGAGLAAHRARVRQHVRAEAELQVRVQEALARIKTLSGMLPICAWCKRVREDDGYWKQIETYVSDHSQAEFTHGICPSCAQSQLQDIQGGTS